MVFVFLFFFFPFVGCAIGAAGGGNGEVDDVVRFVPWFVPAASEWSVDWEALLVLACALCSLLCSALRCAALPKPERQAQPRGGRAHCGGARAEFHVVFHVGGMRINRLWESTLTPAYARRILQERLQEEKKYKN